MSKGFRESGEGVKIFLLGLGLIGGSIAKALKASGNYEIWAHDLDQSSLLMALDEGVIDHRGTYDDLGRMDVIIVALPLKATMEFLKYRAKHIPKGPLIVDTCGVKKDVCQLMEKVIAAGGPTCLGAHPMAGRELYGYEHSLKNLYYGASLIVCPLEKLEPDLDKKMRRVARDIGFAHIEVSDPHKHDRIIAYTSQLAHIVSSAYIKSPTMLEKDGFSAGSFRDMTRVARLEAKQWADLMMANRAHLSQEIDIIVDALHDFQNSLNQMDLEALKNQLQEGNDRKVWSSRHTKAF